MWEKVKLTYALRTQSALTEALKVALSRRESRSTRGKYFMEKGWEPKTFSTLYNNAPV